MRHLLLAARLDIAESLRARWFLVYSLIFGGIVVVLLLFGLTESRVMGFTGLSRLLVTYIQLTMAILPVFVLISTVRSVAGDREAGVFEYMLSLPVSLASWYWGKLLGRFVTVFLPVLLGVGFLISSIARSSDVAQSAAFMLWLVLLLFMDLVLLGLLMRDAAPVQLVVAIALTNPLQVFRTASMMLFDPQLVLLGPAAFVILDHFGQTAYLAWAIVYPGLLGAACAWIGFQVFRRGDYP